ncbi:hypothetical protein ACFYYH_16965 [Streptomyces sp. NPDC002018]|uniref:hypothetical protein n=1 Tax=Streptomyces sp. NPDC002018 TaxID=3364629 RepID=UPI0036A4C736
MDISGTRLRATRAALFTALVVTLSAGSHVLLSRAPVPLSLVAALSAVVFLLAYAAAGRERGYWRIAALLVPLELAADTVFTSGQHVCYGPAGGPVAGSLRSVGFDLLCGGALGAPLPAVVSPDSTAATLLNSPDPALPWLLLAAHVAIGLFAAYWLRHGESALSGLVRAVAVAAFRPLLIAVTVVGTAGAAVRRAVRPADGPRRARTRLLVHSVGRRGPPRPALSSV